MNSTAILLLNRGTAARAVTIEIGENAVYLEEFGRSTEEVSLRSLVKRSDDGNTLRLGRRGHRDWELVVRGQTASELRSRLPRVSNRIYRLVMGVHFWPIVAAVAMFAITRIPADWTAATVGPRSAQRLVPASWNFEDRDLCHSAAGEQAIRHLIARLDPKLARQVRIEVVRANWFAFTSAPGRRLVTTKQFLMTAQPDEVAALTAIEVAHLQRNDAVEAVFRANGPARTYSSMFFGWGDIWDDMWGDTQTSFMRFSRQQEHRADAAAIAMLRRAGIAPDGGAEILAKMGDTDVPEYFYLRQQNLLHPSDPERVALWSAAAKQADAPPAFTPDEGQALFDYCWKPDLFQRPDQPTPQASSVNRI